MFDVVNPMPTSLVTTRGKDSRGKIVDNVLTIAWQCPLSFQPQMFGISVAKTRYSFSLISESKVFCVNFLTYEQKDLALSCGQTTGMNTDKFQKFRIAKDECETIDCCRLANYSGYLECEVVEQVDVGDHVFFIGKVLKSSGTADSKRLLHLGEGRFTTVR
jgi:flavin reductase (DIM6/NTAB) family NADH-FMN oxidoreductase RutF